MNNSLLTFCINETTPAVKKATQSPKQKQQTLKLFSGTKKRTHLQAFPESFQRIRYGTFAFQGARRKSTAFHLD